MDNSDTILSELKTLRDVTAKKLNVTLSIKYNSKINTITLINIERDHTLETKGHGSKVMEELISIADTYNSKIRLDVESHSSQEQANLIKYYTKFGFVINKKDYAFSPDDNMYLQGKIKGGEFVQSETFGTAFLMNRTPKKKTVKENAILSFRSYLLK